MEVCSYGVLKSSLRMFSNFDHAYTGNQGQFWGFSKYFSTTFVSSCNKPDQTVLSAESAEIINFIHVILLFFPFLCKTIQVMST